MSEQSLYPLPPPAASRSSSVGQRNDSEGVGKFKSAAPRTTTKYKEKFHVLRETYDHVTSKHEEHLRELELANAKLRKLQAENDLLLDAMMLVASGQPTLLPFLDPQPPSPDVMNEVDANGLSHAPGFPVNGDSMEYEMDPNFFRPRSEINGRHT